MLAIVGLAATTLSTVLIVATGRDDASDSVTAVTDLLIGFGRTMILLSPAAWVVQLRYLSAVPTLLASARRAWWIAVGTSAAGVALVIVAAVIVSSALWTPIVVAAVAAALLAGVRAFAGWAGWIARSPRPDAPASRARPAAPTWPEYASSVVATMRRHTLRIAAIALPVALVSTTLLAVFGGLTPLTSTAVVLFVTLLPVMIPGMVASAKLLPGLGAALGPDISREGQKRISRAVLRQRTAGLTDADLAAATRWARAYGDWVRPQLLVQVLMFVWVATIGVTALNAPTPIGIVCAAILLVFFGGSLPILIRNRQRAARVAEQAAVGFADSVPSNESGD
ncbi:hypothetical protein FJ658_09795 [Schumannella sp. 10F1B-5-1]|nr:hypothetical protein FJ658_09795 [Schumannella sp. 10F1B-5-1]